MTHDLAFAAIQHAHSQEQHFLKGLHELLAIPSVSTDPAYKADLERCAEWIADEMTRIGMKQARKIATDGHPIVYSEWLAAGADKPTIAIYAHYDVQPIVPIELWETPPFEPSVRNGRIYARGACDDKCAVWGVLKALESMFTANGTLPVNVKLVFEGEEETGSQNMQPFALAHKDDLLKADLFILCDGGFNPDKPEQPYALRGMVGVEVIVRAAGHDLHSGEFGGAVQNALHAAGKIIGSFHDENGRIQIPGFYDAVRGLSAAEKANLDAILGPQVPELKARVGVKQFWAESLGSFAERTTALPTLDVNGMWGGYQGLGAKTVIPCEAGFKVSMRIVPDQNPNDIARKLVDYVHRFASDTVSIETTVQATGWHFTLTYEGPIAEALNSAFMATCGKTPQWIRIGSSGAFGGMFQSVLGIPMMGFGFGAGDNYHAPNEFLRLDHFGLAIDTFIHYLYNLAEPGVFST